MDLLMFGQDWRVLSHTKFAVVCVKAADVYAVTQLGLKRMALLHGRKLKTRRLIWPHHVRAQRITTRGALPLQNTTPSKQPEDLRTQSLQNIDPFWYFQCS